MTSDIWGHFYFGASKPPYKPNYSFILRSPVFGKSSGRNLELWFTFSVVKGTNISLGYYRNYALEMEASFLLTFAFWNIYTNLITRIANTILHFTQLTENLFSFYCNKSQIHLKIGTELLFIRVMMRMTLALV